MTRAVAGGEITADEEWIIKRPSGEAITVLCNAAPIRDAEGRVTGGLIVWRDVTQRKLLEERLRESAKLESLGILAGGIAHDFNNLLTGVLGNASLLLETMPENSPQWSFAQGITEAAERAATLTQQMLAYSGRGRFVIEQLDLSAFFRESAALVHASIPKTVDLRLELDESLPPVEADASQLQQVLMNLVINGAEAVGAPGGRVTVAASSCAIDESSLPSLAMGQPLKPGVYVVIEVSDTGCGMDEKTLKRIFDPFFTTKFAGRGLGLAAVQGIVRGHKGAIQVDSAPGQGTTVRMFLPACAEASAASPENLAVARSAAPRRATVLVIDDEEIVRSTANNALRTFGYAVVTASDGAGGVDVFRAIADQVSVVLLDMTMPGISGEQTLHKLREIRPDVPVVLSSGFSEAEALRRFGRQRLAGFLQKPYTVRALEQRVNAAASGGN